MHTVVMDCTLTWWQMGNFINDVEEYNIGSEFMAYIRRHPEQMEEPEDYLFEEFDPDAEYVVVCEVSCGGDMCDTSVCSGGGVCSSM